MKPTKTILFVSNVKASFVENDVKILKTKYNIIEFYYEGNSKLNNFKSIIKLLYTFIFNIFKIQATYSWFVDYHSFLAVVLSKLFLKKSYLVVGGYDAIFLPEYNYGALVNPFRRICVKIALKLSTLNFYVSEYIMNKLIQNLNIKKNTKYKLIYNCVETDFWEQKTIVNRKNQVVCVSFVDSYKKYKIKGIDFYIELAELCPKVNFIWIGNVWKDFDKNYHIPNNLKIYSKLNKEEIRKIMYESKIIAQFSLSESFCVSIIEGIMCGLIPITFKDLGSAELFDNIDYQLEREKIKVQQVILKALTLERENTNFKEFVKINFSFKKRKEKLLNLI